MKFTHPLKNAHPAIKSTFNVTAAIVLILGGLITVLEASSQLERKCALAPDGSGLCYVEGKDGSMNDVTYR